MENFLKDIKYKLKKNIKMESIIVINNSDKHKKHRFYDKNKYHIALEIESKYLSDLDKLKAQRVVMNILKEELKSKIHALEIKIK